MAEPPILSLEGIGLQQGGRWLFSDLDLHIAPRDRIALIGRNGAGKTTLFRTVMGEIEPDRGLRKVKPHATIVLLDQEPDFTGFATLMGFALAGTSPPAEHAVEAIAGQLGIDMATDAATASGGERRRAAIARALALEPDLLLMDEPTNHLDLAAIDWLESWLDRYKGAFIVISHDRTFLKRLTRATLWLDRGGLRRKDVGFGGYEAWEEQVYAEEARAAQKMDAKLKIEAHWLERGVTARRKRNMGRLEKLWDMRAARAAMINPAGTAKLKLASDDDFKSKSVIVAENISKTYGTREVIKPFSLRIQRRDRIGIVGANGAGKTTLLKLLTREIAPDSGSVTHANTLSGVSIDQQRALLEPGKTVRQIVAEGGDWVDVRGTRKHVQAYLKDFLFDPALVDAKIGTFSGGERSRLLLAREFARVSNLLVLDEPTNDLDLETLDLLQEVIADYEGTVLIVSHDRDFLDRTVTVTLGLDGSGKVDIVAGGYEEWETQRREQRAPARSPATDGAPATASPPPPPPPSTKLSYRDQRDYELLPARIAELDELIAKGEAALADPDLYRTDKARFDRISKSLDLAREEKDAAEERWLELAERVEG
ncbi:ATP-binding cassette domain-containing protein [Erythrobacter arachoides]|uniref:ATP-binding cassette domain-containing protein n=1 Tax=Aurantiacibacter arachoides TaxID=1850444 RepID=A0A844ZYB6_9SPHN|nr:ABC-F family ATP-binding cassette domain-containing protein [Aurantiacibacter arachoides]MXO92885.1 ATP-binding cassette domain-containing protein [Aurantiacibacter arachoides]GGD53706.1 elongation factor 3 [Aurantiacibacter arachoides]